MKKVISAALMGSAARRPCRDRRHRIACRRLLLRALGHHRDQLGQVVLHPDLECGHPQSAPDRLRLLCSSNGTWVFSETARPGEWFGADRDMGVASWIVRTYVALIWRYGPSPSPENGAEVTCLDVM